jgi:putative ABC transport system substrate-binding protein
MVLDTERVKQSRDASPRSSRDLIGVSIEVSIDEKFRILRELLPDLKRVGVLTYDPALRPHVAAIERACAERKLEFVHAKLAALSELPSKLEQLLGQVDLVWSVPDTQVFQPELARHIIGQCAARNVPLVGLSAVFVKAGATLSFERDYQELGQLLARRCLSEGSSGDPYFTIASPERTVVYVNQRSFNSLGLSSDLQLPQVNVVKY